MEDLLQKVIESMKGLIVQHKKYINQAFLENDVVRRVDVKLKDDTSVKVKITYKNETEKELGSYEDTTKVKNCHIAYPFNIEKIAKKININPDEIDHLIAAIDIDCDESMSTGEELKLNVIQPLNIIVLVAGTTDPINVNGNVTSRAESYQSKYIYWNDQFMKGIREYQAANKKSVILFDKHGWTGDNRVQNREIAGAYLVNRLCGAEGQKPYYPAYKKRAVHFHLVGHSHGGNVINEMTKQMAKLGEKWPEKWKVKSITYLSTPFFNTIHQAKVTDKTFHKDAEVLNVYNKYDLTQNMLADFSLEPLTAILNKIDFTPLEAKIEKLQKFKFSELDWSLKDVDKRWYGVDLEVVVPHAEGKAFYDEIITLLNTVNDIMEDILGIIGILSKEITFAVGEEITNDLGEEVITHKRVAITKEIVEGLNTIIKTIQGSLHISINNLEKRNQALASTDRSYALVWFIEDIEMNDLVKNLLDFLQIDAETLVSENPKTSLWHLLYQILDHNIKYFDNTYVDPTPQFKNSFLANKIEQYNVSHEDKYDGSDGSKNFDAFISYVKGIENRCTNKPSEYDLLDLVFTLLGQMGVVYKYKGVGFGTALKIFANWWRYNRWSHLSFSASDFEKRLFQLADVVDNYQKIFQARDFGGIVDTQDVLTKNEKKEGKMQRGTINYLLIVSHSISRKIFYPRVKEFFQKVCAKK